MMMSNHQLGGPVASLPLEGRDRGWGSFSDPQYHPLPSPPRKGEGAQEPKALIQNSRGHSHG